MHHGAPRRGAWLDERDFAHHGLAQYFAYASDHFLLAIEILRRAVVEHRHVRIQPRDINIAFILARIGHDKNLVVQQTSGGLGGVALLFARWRRATSCNRRNARPWS